MVKRSDMELLAASAGEDSGAFDELMRRHADAVTSYLRGLTTDLDAAWDLAQETFLAVWQARRRFSPEAKVRTWIFTIARNRYVDWVRRKKRQNPESPAVPTAPPAHAELEKREQIEQAMSLLETLPEVEREVLVLRVLEGMPYSEISAITRMPENALRAYASRGLSRLREALR